MRKAGYYYRNSKITFKFATQAKRDKIKNLLKEYRRVVNFYIPSLWNERGKLDRITYDRLPRSKTRLTSSYQWATLKQALGIVVRTRLSLRATKNYTDNIPKFNGAAVLSARFITVEKGKGAFDLIVKVSTFQPRKRIIIPTKRTKVLNKWLNKPGAKLVQCGFLSEDHISLFVELSKEKPKKGEVLGIDQGINKLLSDSEGHHYGRNFKNIRDKIVRRKPASARRKKTYKERDNFINQELNKLPWDKLNTLVIEDLKGLKLGKKKNRSKAFRKAIAPWTYRQVITRIEHKAQENRVRLVKINPRNTSRTCPLCNYVDQLNRKGEIFKCLKCNFSGDADYVAALNIKARFLGSVKSPGLKKRSIKQAV